MGGTRIAEQQSIHASSWATIWFRSRPSSHSQVMSEHQEDACMKICVWYICVQANDNLYVHGAVTRWSPLCSRNDRSYHRSAPASYPSRALPHVYGDWAAYYSFEQSGSSSVYRGHKLWEILCVIIADLLINTSHSTHWREVGTYRWQKWILGNFHNQSLNANTHVLGLPSQGWVLGNHG